MIPLSVAANSEDSFSAIIRLRWRGKIQSELLRSFFSLGPKKRRCATPLKVQRFCSDVRRANADWKEVGTLGVRTTIRSGPASNQGLTSPCILYIPLTHKGTLLHVLRLVNQSHRSAKVRRTYTLIAMTAGNISHSRTMPNTALEVVAARRERKKERKAEFPSHSSSLCSQR